LQLEDLGERIRVFLFLKFFGFTADLEQLSVAALNLSILSVELLLQLLCAFTVEFSDLRKLISMLISLDFDLVEVLLLTLSM